MVTAQRNKKVKWQFSQFSDVVVHEKGTEFITMETIATLLLKGLRQ